MSCDWDFRLKQLLAGAVTRAEAEERLEEEKRWSAGEVGMPAGEIVRQRMAREPKKLEEWLEWRRRVLEERKEKGGV